MVLFELLQLARVFLYYLLIEYLWHAFIMPLTNRNGISTVPPAVAATCCARAALRRTSSEMRPRSAVLTTLRPKSPSAAGSSDMPAAPSEDCARSSPDPAGESTPAVFRSTDTVPSSGGADFVSLLPHDARARTRSTSALVSRDLAIFEKRLALMASTSFGRVPPAEHLLAPKGQPSAQPNLCTLPDPDWFLVVTSASQLFTFRLRESWRRAEVLRRRRSSRADQRGMGKISFPIPQSARRFGDADRPLLSHVCFEAQRHTPLLPEQGRAGQAWVHSGGNASGGAPVSRTSVHAHPLELRLGSGLSSEIRWFEIALDLGQNEADPGVSKWRKPFPVDEHDTYLPGDSGRVDLIRLP